MNDEKTIHDEVIRFLIAESLPPACIMLGIWVVVKLTNPYFSDEARANFLLTCAIIFVLFPVSHLRGGWGSIYYHHLNFTRMVHWICGLVLGYLAFRQVGRKGFEAWTRDKKLGFVVAMFFLFLLVLGMMPWSLFQ